MVRVSLLFGHKGRKGKEGKEGKWGERERERRWISSKMKGKGGCLQGGRISSRGRVRGDIFKGVGYGGISSMGKGRGDIFTGEGSGGYLQGGRVRGDIFKGEG